MDRGDSGRSARKRTGSQTETDVLDVSDHSKGTDCESEGAFTPTNSTCYRVFEDRPKAGDVSGGGYEEQIPNMR